MSNDYKKYLKITAKQSGLTFSIRVISYILSFFLQALFARLLGSNNYGLYALGFNLVSMAIIFTTFGMPSAMPRFLGEFLGKKEYNKSKSIINAGFLIVSLTSVLAFFVLIIFKNTISIKIFNKPELEKLLPYFGLILIINSFLSLFSGLFRGIKNPSKFSFHKDLNERIIRIGLFIGLYYLGFRLFGAIISTIMSNLIIMIILFYEFYKTKLIDFSVKPKFSELKDVFKYSLTMFFVGVTSFLLNQVNITISGMYLESSKVAIYSISNTIATLSTFFLTSINSVFAAVISELFHTNKIEDLKRLYSTIIRLVIIFTTPLTIWLTMYSKEILNFFGKEYINGYIVLVFLALGQFANAVVGPNGLMLAMTKYQKFSLINGILIATLNISLNIILIPKLGIVGSAIAGTTAITSINILKSIEVYFLLKIQPYDRKIIKPIISGLLTVIVIFVIKNLYNSFNIFFVGLMLIISYSVFVLIQTILRWDKDDLELLKALIRKIRNKV